VEHSDGVHNVILNTQYNDNQWHQLTLLRKDGQLNLTVDGTTESKTPNSDFEQLNLDKSILVGGMGQSQRFDTTCHLNVNKKNFIGCIEDVYFNSINVLVGAKEGFQEYKVHGGTLPFTCNAKEYEIIGLHSEQSYLIATRNMIDMNKLRIAMEFRTFEPDGHIFSHQSTGGGAFLALVKEKLRLTLKFIALSDTVVLDSDVKLNDGNWHTVEIVIRRREKIVNLNVDGKEQPYQFRKHLNFSTEFGLFTSRVRFGNALNLHGLVTCFRKIELGNKVISLKSGKQNIQKKYLISDTCQVRDLCFPSPCQHGSTCSQSRGQVKCDCTGTGYSGARCESCVYKRTCEEYKASGETKSGLYKVCPKNEHIFNVHCDMQTGATIVKHSVRNDTRVGKGDLLDGFYYHNINYDTRLRNIRELMNESLTCRQYIRYDCFNSRLLFGVGRLRSIHFKGARWVAGNSIIQHYWGGGTPESRMCGCGVDGTCAKDASGKTFKTFIPFYIFI